MSAERTALPPVARWHQHGEVPTWSRRNPRREFLQLLEAYYLGRATHEQLRRALLSLAEEHP